jgi:hypothetical protein
MLISGIGACLHVLMPSFEADKAAVSVLLDMDLLEDSDGRLAAYVASPPVLPPFDISGTRNAIGRALFSVLPIREISDVEMQRMNDTLPPLVIAVQRCASLGITNYNQRLLNIE